MGGGYAAQARFAPILANWPKLHKNTRQRGVEKHSNYIRLRYGTHRLGSRALIQGAPHLFENGAGLQEKDQEVLTAQLYPQIGQLKVERDFLSRSFGL